MSESQEKEDIELKEMKISDLTPFDRRLQVTFVVIEKGESRTITSKKTNEEHTLADIKVGDETGTIILTLWDGTIDQVSEGSTYVVKNGYINVFQQHMRLALGKWGTLEESEDTVELDAVNMDNDRSEEIHEDRRRRRRRPRRSPGFSSYDRNQSDSGSRY
ncbi:MAG: single-stranded DNA-binding protein [Candidatus Hodarchaeota archaeon]